MLSLRFSRWGGIGSETVGAKHTCWHAGLWLVGPIAMAGVNGAGGGAGQLTAHGPLQTIRDPANTNMSRVRLWWRWTVGLLAGLGGFMVGDAGQTARRPHQPRGIRHD